MTGDARTRNSAPRDLSHSVYLNYLVVHIIKISNQDPWQGLIECACSSMSVQPLLPIPEHEVSLLKAINVLQVHGRLPLRASTSGTRHRAGGTKQNKQNAPERCNWWWLFPLLPVHPPFPSCPQPPGPKHTPFRPLMQSLDRMPQLAPRCRSNVEYALPVPC